MKKILFITAILLCCTHLKAQSLLEYKLAKGDTFTIQQNAKQVIIQEIQGMSHELTNTIDGEYMMKVTAINDDSYNIEMSFTDLNMKMSSNLQGDLMDIKAKEVTTDNPQSAMFNAILNIPISIVLAKNGDITSVTGGDAIINKMMATSGITDEATLKLVKKSLSKEYGTEGLASSFEQMTYLYPTTKVKVGDSWENNYTGKLDTKNKWTLQTYDTDTTVLSCEASVIMSIKDAAANMDLTGTQTTKLTANSKTGFIKEMEVIGTSSGSSTMPMLGDQQIPTKITSTIIYKTIEE